MSCLGHAPHGLWLKHSCEPCFGVSCTLQDFAKKRDATYPIFAKIDVNGGSADPLYKFLTAKIPGVLGSSIKWNFAKFLCDAEGVPVKRFGPQDSPLTIEGDIKELLSK
ncbi:unnamed protein product [Discosporangium mesarthrocarpum]